MDFDDEVSSVSVDAADLMQATVLVMTGFIVSSVASQAVCRRNYSLLQPTHWDLGRFILLLAMIGSIGRRSPLQRLAFLSGTEPERDSSVRLMSSSFSMIVDCLRVSSTIVGYTKVGSRSREC